MAWVDVPGKGRRWRNADGSYSYAAPGGIARSPIWGQIRDFVTNPNTGFVRTRPNGTIGIGIPGWAGLAGAGAGAGGSSQRPAPQSSPRPAGAPAPSLSPAPGAPGTGGAVYTSPYRQNRDLEFNRVRFGGADGRPAPAPARSAPPAPSSGGGGGAAPGMGQTVLATPASRERRAELNRMITQGGGQPLPLEEDLRPFWAQAGNADLKAAATPGAAGFVRAGEQGNSERADIQAWLDANQGAGKGADGRNIVDRYLLQEYERGTLGEKGLAMARARGLVKDAPVDYSASFETQPQVSAADAFGNKFDLPQFSSANSDNIKQWPQQAMAPEQITEAYSGGMDLDPRNSPQNAPTGMFAAQMRGDYGSSFAPGGPRGGMIANIPAQSQGGYQFPGASTEQANAAILAGFKPATEQPQVPTQLSDGAMAAALEGFRPKATPVQPPGAVQDGVNAFGANLDLGVSYADPDGNQQFADELLENAKRRVKLAFGGGQFQ